VSRCHATSTSEHEAGNDGHLDKDWNCRKDGQNEAPRQHREASGDPVVIREQKAMI
jgi:hypothetical protein